MDAVERVEVAMRTTISDVMGLTHGSHWYMDKALFVDSYNLFAYSSCQVAGTGIVS